MSRLHIYTVHINPALPQPYEHAVFIEERFNWKAFIFAGFWAAYYRLWLPLLAIILFGGAMFYLSGRADDMGINHYGVVSLELGVHILIGYFANDWRRAKLKQQGYITADIVTGDSLIRAEQRFFDRYFGAKDTEK